jgi:hypothetical protein
MKVAQQFIAGMAFQRRVRPVRDDRNISANGPDNM